MFLGPLEDMKPWSTKGIEGIARFLRRIFKEVIDEKGQIGTKMTAQEDSEKLLKVLHQTIKKVTEDIEGLRFNTAISQLMICLNQFQESTAYTQKSFSQFLQLIAPFAPHIAEELWGRMGHAPSISNAPWPQHEARYLHETHTEMAVQINGRVRGHILIATDAPESVALAAIEASYQLKVHLDKVTIKKLIYIPGKILNIVC
jgi:leucyl-tRNA synthetase